MASVTEITKITQRRGETMWQDPDQHRCGLALRRGLIRPIHRSGRARLYHGWEAERVDEGRAVDGLGTPGAHAHEVVQSRRDRLHAPTAQPLTKPLLPAGTLATSPAHRFR
jgi:hypothetical protein